MLTYIRSKACRLALAGLLVAPESALAERVLEYLHVEAGSGASGGGHAAVRLDGTTYHYVYAEPGVIVSNAEPNEQFDFGYRALGNRSIHVSRVALSDADFESLADAFERRHVTQRAQLELFASAGDDEAVIARLREIRCAAPRTEDAEREWRLGGAGYFEGSDTAELPRAPLGDDVPAVRPLSHAELRAEIERAHGRGYLERRAHEVAARMRTLAYAPRSIHSLAEGVMPPATGSFATRFEALAAAHLALDVLIHGRSPRAEAFRSLDALVVPLGPDEIARLRERESKVRASVVRLAVSRRDDWGRPLLVALARLVALDASIRSGRLVVPDAFDADAPSVDVATLLEDRPVALALLDERRQALDDARAALAANAPSSELAWSRLEVTATAALDLDRAIRLGHGDVRAYSTTMLPSRSARITPSWPLPDAACSRLAQWSERARSASETIRSSLRRIYRYDLVSRNCVTELFRTMGTATPAMTLYAGGVAGETLSFVPFVAASAVNEIYPVVEREMLPSYRSYWLEKLREQGSALAVALRESNTLTTTLRHPDERDDVFLFYTDATVALRPFYGAANAVVGAGSTLVGLATIPFDGGALLKRSARSVVFSFPELVFVSLRKGKNGILPLDWTNALARGH